MKTSTVCRLFVVSVILVFGILTPTLAQNPEAQFQQGLMKEEGEGSLQEAIDIYIKVASDELLNDPCRQMPCFTWDSAMRSWEGRRPEKPINILFRTTRTSQKP